MIRTHRHLLRPARRAVVALGLVILFVASSSPLAAQEEVVSNTYLANIDASGVQFHVAGAGLPLATVIDVSPWAALGRLENSQSLGQAGVPYLGDFITPLIGTVNGLGGGGTNLPPLPTAPGYVSSSHPNDPAASQENAGFLISAESGQREVESRVQVGAPPVGGDGNSTIFARAHADFDVPGGVLTARGESGVEALNIGGIVSIGNVSSSVQVVDDGDQDPQVDFSTDVGAVTVLGIPVGIDEDGVSILGTSLPVLEPVDAVVSDALESLGLSLRVVPAQTTVDEETGRVNSVTTGALEIGFEVEVPALGLVEVRLTIGRVFLQFVNRPFASSPTVTSAVPASPDSDSNTPNPASAPSAAPAPQPSVSSGDTSAPPPTSTETSTSPAPVASTGVPDSTSLFLVYLILVLAGLAVVGPATLFERAGLVARRIWR